MHPCSSKAQAGMFRFFHIIALLVAFCAPSLVHAQDDVPLGDLARQFRKSRSSEDFGVIDNDNIGRFMDKAESERLDGQPIFSVTPKGVFNAISPDGACSLSFDGRLANRMASTFVATDLPQSELLKIEGPATIHDGALEVSVHNGTHWDLKEIVVGITLPQVQAAPPAYRFATMQAVSETSSEKRADPAVLYHLKGNASADSSSVFRADINSEFSEGLSQAKDWHWLIIGARGIPPAAQPATVASANSQSSTQSDDSIVSTPTANSQTTLAPDPSAQGSSSAPATPVRK
jgi:hypothetical protein